MATSAEQTSCTNHNYRAYWDNSADSMPRIAAALNSGGFRAPHRIAACKSTDRERGRPRVVCVQGRAGTLESHLRALRDVLGPRVYLICGSTKAI